MSKKDEELFKKWYKDIMPFSLPEDGNRLFAHDAFLKGLAIARKESEVKEKTEVLEYYANEMNYSIDHERESESGFRVRCVLHGDTEERNNSYAFAGRAAREVLKKWGKG